jgi:GT2 family glycosyltransferase
MSKDLNISIVNYKMKESLMRCVKSIYKSKDCLDIDIYIVDNNSNDGSVEEIRETYPEINLIVNKENKGFARANNQVLRILDSKYCLILNPDVILFPGTLGAMVNFMDANPEAGISGCKVLNTDGSLQYSCRRYPLLTTIMWRALLLDLFFPKNKIIGKYLMKDWAHDSIKPVNWLTGCCLLIRKETLKDIGLMNDKFFLYFEDTDLCLRTNEKWKVFYLPHIHVVHEFQHKSRKFGHLRHTMHHVKSAFHFFREHGIIPINGNK